MEKPKDIFEVLDVVRNKGVSDEQIYSSVNFFLEQKARETFTPICGTFELTPFCNLNCKMCYVHLNETQVNGRKLLSADSWIDLMNQATEAGMMKAVLTGGECLTYSEFNKVYLFLQSKRVSVTVKTNGVLLDSERIDFFKRYPPYAVLISLYGHTNDGYEKVTGKRVFLKVLENIQMAVNANLPVTIMITPSSCMGEDVKATIRFAKDLNIPYVINSTLMTPRPETHKKKVNFDLTVNQYIDILQYDSLLNNVITKEQEVIPFPKNNGDESQYELKGVRCGAGKSLFSVRWDGCMYPCVSMDSISDTPLKNGFSAAWEHINMAVNGFPRFTKCERCEYSHYCTYCVAENEKLGSRFLLDQIWCKRTWKLVESGLASSDRECE